MWDFKFKYLNRFNELSTTRTCATQKYFDILKFLCCAQPSLITHCRIPLLALILSPCFIDTVEEMSRMECAPLSKEYLHTTQLPRLRSTFMLERREKEGKEKRRPKSEVSRERKTHKRARGFLLLFCAISIFYIFSVIDSRSFVKIVMSCRLYGQSWISDGRSRSAKVRNSFEWKVRK